MERNLPIADTRCGCSVPFAQPNTLKGCAVRRALWKLPTSGLT
jgi:hypothetical protein